MARRKSQRSDKGRRDTSWDPLATWYDGWVGKDGSEHHRKLAIPAVLDLLQARAGENILDLGAGQGVLAADIQKARAAYCGVDASPRLIQMARKNHPGSARFVVGDTRDLRSLAEVGEAQFDAAVFLLSIQDMEPLEPVLAEMAWALKPAARVVMLMTHPAFRIPRQSGWGWDENRKLRFRRIDRYLTPLEVPLKPYPGGGGVSKSHHRPISAYVNGMAECGFAMDRMLELPTYKQLPGKKNRPENLANREIPLFLALRFQRLPATT
jgi:SAM-dependent methyltransferase